MKSIELSFASVRPLQLICLLFSLSLSFSLSAQPLTDYQRCLLRQLDQAAATQTVADIKAQCDLELAGRAATEGELDEVAESEQPETGSMIANRRDAEKATRQNPFVISPHKQNYVLLASYNAEPNFEVYNIPESDFDRWEIKFQLSYKMPVVEGLFGSDMDLYAAYTNLSFWQAYNRDISSPFRETNHEPELFLVVPDMWPDEWQLDGWRNALMQFGVVHQSNGQGGYLSRSWNRLYADLKFEKRNFLLGLKSWYRIPEDNDDNPHIDDYLGRYEIHGLYKKQQQTFSLMLRNLFDGDSRDTVKLDWSFPLYGRWRGYLQYFNGYGESLIDFDAKSHRLGFGLQLTDWL
ncbi:MAG: phospholipase A [Candidatus Thiodiazotropha taylori]|nr:phospholipase A [Candidatus Thiodiazotropha taylori]MCW4327219.1 phospholipase A [Candidatus Thiodiazotropha taylori]